MNLMAVDTLSVFGKALREAIKETKPTKIIETGTYLGRGTTTVITSAIRDFNINLTKFYSIEVNPSYYRSAYVHLKNCGLLKFVELINGLSIYRKQLPNRIKIKEEFLDKEWPDYVYIDHSKETRIDKYFEETDFVGVPEGMLITCLGKLDQTPDLVLLDSGGHVGEIEFDTLIPILKGPCIIALDDIYHVKHFNSLMKIRGDKRFEILELSKEKFGFCITKFSPEE